MSRDTVVSRAVIVTGGNPARLNALADRVQEDARGRSIFVELRAAFLARALRKEAAKAKDRQP